ncbi:MAG: hypothetical protein MJ170_01340 [Alphaproteobacteria bacterium]|nr:hypothetical protein [Alphaproteobacteria bacterium]
MNIQKLALLLCCVPVVAFGAVRSGTARIGVNGAAATACVPNIKVTTVTQQPVGAEKQTTTAVVEPEKPTVSETPSSVTTGDCRDAYRACMDEFCLLDESEGYRCACSDNIQQSKSLIKEIMSLQEEADKLYTEGVERENLGAKADLVFGTSDAAKKSSGLSGINFADWLNTGGGSEEELDADYDIGANLYAMASEYCAAELQACGDKAQMEETLYSRQIVSDCKAYSAYLADQKTNATANKRTAEAAVRKARLEMLDVTNKYNRGECLLAYKACVADKGGCGVNFENCLDKDLLQRRANACSGILDQCMAVRKDVVRDWEEETVVILAEAEKYADKNRRATCLAKIQNCLEEGCATSTNSMCLTDVNVAAGVCPIITECEEMIPGIQSVVNDKLAYLRTGFCQNDVDACLRDKCGAEFTAPECVGKNTSQIVALCPQSMFPSCKNEKQFDIIVSAALLEMDYQMMQGCVNHFATQLSAVCGTDMACLPNDSTVEGLLQIPDSEEGMIALRDTVRGNSDVAVDDFFKQFEKDITIAACMDSQKPANVRKRGLGDSVFNTAKMIAKINAENRSLRALETKIAEISRQQDLAAAEKNCLKTYAPEKPNKDSKNYSYIRSVAFEPALRNCHVCRMQQVCEVGGESKATSALKAAAGGLSGGAAMGTMVNAGWGTAIGGVVGAVGAGLVGMASGGEKEFCQEIESCEDINM